MSSHVFGLRNSAEVLSVSLAKDVPVSLAKGEEGARGHEGAKEEGMEWLTSNEGAEWVLETVDEIVKVVMGEGRSFAGPVLAKL